ncbi:MAG TPA: hypothetical protein VK151_06345 [Fluviicola sp.]|nr:hypothetical protein [Fluviicola sp.]
MKKSIVIAVVSFFIMSIMAKDITSLSWNIWYLANKDYVAKELCVNKARPKMKCNGKCHLAKQLQKLEEPQPKKAPVSPKPLKLKELEWTITSVEILPATETSVSDEKTLTYWNELKKAPRSFSNTIFHPPQA